MTALAAGASFSLAERDRRWRAVAAKAAEAVFDCILVPHCLDGGNLNLSLEQSAGARSDGRYLTQMDDAAVALPSDGRQPIIVNESGEPNAWAAAPRAAGGSWGIALADALRDLGMERARIGVSGLGRGRVTHGRAADGVIAHSSYTELKRQLPHATFENATDVVGFARYVKSDEEISFLRTGAEIAVAGIERMIELARPGVDLAEVYAGVMERMLEMGSAYYPLAIYAAPVGSRGPRYENPPAGFRLERGCLITHETDALVAGLVAQELQPILLGPVPEEWKPVVDMQAELFQAGMELMKPGATLRELVEFVNGFGAKRGMKSLTLMHGRGYGNDGPLLTPQDRDPSRLGDLRFEAGNVLVWKPIAYSAGERIDFSWGGCVLVTPSGGQQLVPRQPGLVSVA